VASAPPTADGLTVADQMLVELPEDAATGEIAGIYEEIRQLWAVPYVSSLQRHLATKPGWLEWSWAALNPAFRSGQAQDAGWRVATDLPLPPLASFDAREFGLSGGDLRLVAQVCAGFVRVAPVNLMFAGLLRHLLAEERPQGAGWPGAGWQPPEALPVLPTMLDPALADEDTRTSLLKLGTDVDGTPFVPGLYRILARWPAYFSHLARVLVPLFTAPGTDAARVALLAGVDGAVVELFAQLPPIPDAAMPDMAEIPAILSALDTYRGTSPEMVIFGRLISDALK
tara:strand:- start:12007 stop:12861 length:855 start_codon:yes stop_codon:yes gene_type:complete